MIHWIEIGALTNIPKLGARIVRRQGGDIAIFRTENDEVFALDDRCPHKGGPLSQGIVHGHHVTCPLHNFVINLANGEAMAPDEGCTHAHQVRVTNGIVHLGIKEPLAVANACP